MSALADARAAADSPAFVYQEPVFGIWVLCCDECRLLRTPPKWSEADALAALADHQHGNDEPDCGDREPRKPSPEPRPTLAVAA